MSMLAMLGMLGAGAMSSAGAIYANQKNLDQQIANNNLSVELSNTAHQREVLDLAKAGLNPILSATGSGASVPTLGVATQSNPGEGISEGLSSASNLVSSQYRAQVDNLKANTYKTNADTSAVKVHSDLVNQQRENEEIKADILRNERGSSLDKHFNTKLQEMAITEAITGRRRDGISAVDWDDPAAVRTYYNLVEKYRNQIELERYLNSKERQMLLDGVKSASDLKGFHIHTHKKGKR